MAAPFLRQVERDDSGIFLLQPEEDADPLIRGRLWHHHGMRRRRSKGRDYRVAARRAVEQAISELYKDDRELLAHLESERARIEREMLGANVGPGKRKRLRAEAAAFDEDIQKVRQRIQPKPPKSSPS